MRVIKVGGSEGISLEAVCTDVAELIHEGQQLVLVHGGSNETNIIAEKLGHPPRFVTSVSGHLSRYTDRQTMEIFTMVAAGRINKLLVERLAGGPDPRFLRQGQTEHARLWGAVRHGGARR